jgi:hypothetical protein
MFSGMSSNAASVLYAALWKVTTMRVEFWAYVVVVRRRNGNIGQKGIVVFAVGCFCTHAAGSVKRVYCTLIGGLAFLG